jgi:ssDNA-binding Zn-finger/Zn-ribbon topoisomerase 1
MSFCSKCGNEIKDETANFCSKCGVNLGKVPDFKPCPRCGKNTLLWNNQTWLYQCSNPECRARITLAETQAQETSPSIAKITTEKEINPKKVSHRNKALSISVGFLSIVVVLLGIASFYYYNHLLSVNNQLNEQIQQTQYYSKQLDSTKIALQGVNTQLSDSQNQLALTQSRLKASQSQLTLTQEQLTTSQGQLTSAQNELTSTQVQLKSTQNSLTTMQNQLTTSQNELAQYKGTLNGLGITLYSSKSCSDVVLVDNPEAQNPTWNQLVSFLSQDTTENHTYIKNVYDCSQFSRDVHNNAEAKGIRAAEVQIAFQGELIGHALNAFLTPDYGLVYIDCTGAPDKIDRIETGKEERAVKVNLITETNVRNDYWWDTLNSYYYFENPFTGGHSVVSSIKIYW